MSETPDLLRIEEYRALRATIRERGSLRLIVTTITFSAWAAAILTACALFVSPLFTLVPLAALAAGFEVVFAIHVGVERMGRYVQAQHEPAAAGLARWEQAAMRFAAPGGGVNPLQPALFIAAGLLNLTLGTLLTLDAESAALAQNPMEVVPSALLHLAFFLRVVLASRYAAGQRARDLREFERLAKGE